MNELRTIAIDANQEVHKLTFPAPVRECYPTHGSLFGSRAWTAVGVLECFGGGGWFRRDPQGNIAADYDFANKAARKLAGQTLQSIRQMLEQGD